jgi:hypothetical protein
VTCNSTSADLSHLLHETETQIRYYALKAEAQYDLLTGDVPLGNGSGMVQQLLQDSVQDLTEELRTEVAVMDGQNVQFRPAHSVSLSPRS